MMRIYPYGKFGNCTFSRFVSVVQTDADECLTTVTVVGLSNNTL